MIGLEGKTLSSERLRYRLMQSSDKVTLSELLSDAEVTRTAGFLPAKTQKDFDDFFAALTMYNTCIAILLDEMLMCHKVTHKNLIDSSPLFRYCLTHASCNFFVKTIDSDTSKEI